MKHKHEQKVTFTSKSYDHGKLERSHKQVVVLNEKDSTARDLVSAFVEFMLGQGYLAKSVATCMKDKAEEMEG